MTSSATRFSDALSLVVDAHGGIDSARQAVLSLAVAGRLVPQLSREGRGHDVLAKIRLQRDGQDIQGRSLNRKRDETVSDDQAADASFEIPANWCWARLGEIAIKLGAGSTPLGGKSVYKRSGIKFLRSKNVWDSGLRLDDVAFIDQETHQRMEGTHVRPGDLLLNITGASIGRCAVVPEDFDEGNVSQHVAIVRLVDRDLRAFVHLCLISPYFQALIMGVQVGVSREGLSMKRLQDLQVPVPPVMEQKRIVAKVDQLMALCDDLEAKQTKKRALASQSTHSALSALASAETAAELATAWRRVEERPELLTVSPDLLNDWRSTILELLVDGSLWRDRVDGAAWPRVSVSAILAEPLANGRSVPDGRGGFPVLRLSAFRGRTLDYGQMKEGAWTKEQAKNFIVRPGDVFFVRGNGAIRLVGRACIADKVPVEVAFPDTAIRARLNPLVVDPLWLWHAWESPQTRAQIEVFARTTAGIFKVSQDDILAVTIPLPPLAEQKRSIAKVDHLMSLLDDLEAKLRKQEETATRLAESLASAIAA